jgi:hypothetical protein
MSYQEQLRDQLVSYLDEQYLKSRTLAGVLGAYEATLDLAIRIAKGESCLDVAYLEKQSESLKERTTKAMAASEL